MISAERLRAVSNDTIALHALMGGSSAAAWQSEALSNAYPDFRTIWQTAVMLLAYR